MKYLKIEENKGHFIKDKNQPEVWNDIDQIEKDDLLKLLEYATNENFELDAYDENLLGNKAHQIIYKHLSEKFTSFLLNKDRFKDEAENVYKDAIEKYQ
ncbi:hypothetical protein IRZ71_20110 [Flavobacterium sp. ANB]|uniref:hypothetical protein n=1 Tax=unclassified Flavobacterium TaxID=196869 RepID=UPI0012B9FAAF|nr:MULTISPECIES: hypothetical protein [unclassified Flavobacterium]MBF4518666.1 hypothetical protein [Flavobacterium sp. ANB]MTD67828.1 hypothetical protein [Flavobacterium sp. LC2016-13]